MFSASVTVLRLWLQAPISLPVEGKLVFSPHVYGPDVFGQPYFNDPSFPNNMPDIWSRHFG
jgi:endoglucanase